MLTMMPVEVSPSQDPVSVFLSSSRQMNGSPPEYALQFTVDLEYAGADCFQIMIQFHVLPVFAYGAFFLGIPAFSLNASPDLHFRTLAVHRDAHTDWNFPVFEGLGFLHEEEYRKITSLHCHNCIVFRV